MGVITDASRARSGSIYEVYQSTDKCYIPKSFKEKKALKWQWET